MYQMCVTNMLFPLCFIISSIPALSCHVHRKQGEHSALCSPLHSRPLRQLLSGRSVTVSLYKLHECSQTCFLQEHYVLRALMHYWQKPQSILTSFSLKTNAWCHDP